ncbi:tRNA (adenosine(37)-N6)-threonylcarbamoyltransferase complex ATPase subunit type 1 TsaE [Primorskyibacter aestuariivivens]|uniref:tRNA (adenosine(37)-N6)-threonylcarbamoyltransferase complex ATPase subunit type 1 TsaE n=1 Tax=Primorskyibacter aestuariivivens TaxID=1888912 RepID=UPI00230049D6|nr:tRNA (adenosine(37)-N6)-threonylcarbamoyltransferase complex ATPase subunit type 1 TsaE [Primorskyibacter aestuariivivens]MDA7427644.1 tRNA (adenosine(37)-N6)-threonylcarbamoyltransferase complex ATPase subunit type 1 TsaE [Primorskyibacter aestuariivivens]
MDETPFDIRHLHGPDETGALARHIAPLLGPGDVILLEGEIGAGKSHFARCLIQTLLDHPEDVPSPTFTLVQTYDTPAGEIWHADLYRLGDVSEVDELGLLEAFDTAICLVEWPDRLGPDAPKDALWLRFAPGQTEQERRLSWQYMSPKWAKIAEAIRQ